MKDESEKQADDGGKKKEMDLRKRTKGLALRILRLFAALPAREEARVLGKQVLRSGTSVGAHYREAHRARSTAEFVSKVEVALQELDETGYWLDLLAEGGIVPATRLQDLLPQGGTCRCSIFLVRAMKTATG